LIGDLTEQQNLVADGRSDRQDTSFKTKMRAETRAFNIKQGVRRRHPNQVLAQFNQIMEETSNANSAWEKALMHEQERVEIPEEYKIKDSEMLTNQTGLVTTALDNYHKSKGKFTRTQLSGV